MSQVTPPQVDCLSVGILVADHLCTPIDHLPAVGELTLCDALPLAVGGCAANVAIDLARLDVSVGVIGAVGADIFGGYVCETLKTSGVETSGVRQLADAGTSGTLIVNVAGQDRRYIHTIGANARLSAADIPLARVRQAKVLYVGGYLLMAGLERPGEWAAVLAAARAVGVTTVLDVVLPGPGDHWPKLVQLLPEVDVFLPNDDEAAALTGLADPAAQAVRFLRAGVKTAVITCGERGSYLASAKNKKRLHAPAYPTHFVSGTGAGDAFVAGYIAALLAGDDEHGCLRWGSALGASCVRGVSATESVFRRDEAMRFMQANPSQIREL